MTRKDLLWGIAVASLSLFIFPHCTGSGVKKGANKPPARVVKIKGCIKGRVVNEQGSGFASVVVKTDPPTSPQVTNSRGFFEICYKQQVVDADLGESKKVSLPIGTYTLTVAKEGYHAHPKKFAYNGALVRLEKILMIEKTRPLPQVVQTQQKEQKKTSGLGGKAPIGE